MAEITKTNRQVVKITKGGVTQTAVRYPHTGTIVKTIVIKKNK